jgi:hypothetical protein
MKWRLVAALLVPGIARAALAAEPIPGALQPPAPTTAPATILVEPLAPPREPGGGAPLVAGVLTAFVPFVVGCALWSHSDRGDLERAGTYVMAAGFAAAPWVSHGLQRRWRRATVFGAVSAATAAATLITMEATNPFYAPHLNRQRVAFGMLLTSAMFASAVGVFDSFRSNPTRAAP